MSTALAAHTSAASADWGTPAPIVELARTVLGHIACDPCSSDYWNEHLVKATLFHTEKMNSLSPRAWASKAGPGHETFFINPPGGLVKEFWQFATDRWREGSAVFWVGFSLEQTLYLQRSGLFFEGFARAIPQRRIAFMQTPRAALAKLEEKRSKAHAAGDGKRATKLTLAIEAFKAETDLDGPPLVGEAPTHGCYLVLLPSAHEQVERFRELARALPAEVF